MKKVLGLILSLFLVVSAKATTITGIVSNNGVPLVSGRVDMTLYGCTNPLVNSSTGASAKQTYSFPLNALGSLPAAAVTGNDVIYCSGLVGQTYYEIKAYNQVGALIWDRYYRITGTVWNISTASVLTNFAISQYLLTTPPGDQIVTIPTNSHLSILGGTTLIGDLQLGKDPTAANDAATKSYVDTAIAGVASSAGSGSSSGSGSTNFSAQSANTVLAGPSTGTAATPSFRKLTTSDIPALPYDTNGAASAVQSATLQKSNNLNDVQSVSASRTNLGLGSASTMAGGNSANQLLLLDSNGTIPVQNYSTSGIVTAISNGTLSSANIQFDYDFRQNGSLLDISSSNGGVTGPLTVGNNAPTFSSSDHAYTFATYSDGTLRYFNLPPFTGSISRIDFDLYAQAPNFSQTYINSNGVTNAMFGPSNVGYNYVAPSSNCSYTASPTTCWPLTVLSGGAGQFAFQLFSSQFGNYSDYQTVGGHAIVTFICDSTNVNHIIINGQETTLTAQGGTGGGACSANSIVSPNYYAIGGAIANGWPFFGKLYRVRGYVGGVQTVAQAIADQNTMLYSDSLYGIPPVRGVGGFTNGLTNVVIGTSIEAGFGSYTCSGDLMIGPVTGSTSCGSWPNQVTNSKYTYKIFNLGVYNSSNATWLSHMDEAVLPLALPATIVGGNSPSGLAGGANILTVGAPTNDAYSSIANAQSAWSRQIQIIRKAKAAGFLVEVTSMLSRGDYTNGDSGKNVYNSLVRGNWKAAGADIFSDQAADPVLGADNAYASTTYFNDKVHPTVAGQVSMASSASRARAAYFGSTSSNPTVVASTVSSANISGGSGYTTPPTVSFAGGSCSIVPVATASISNGSVSSLTFSTSGTCESAPTIAFSGGGFTTAATATAVLTPVSSYTMNNGDTYVRLVCIANCTITLPNVIGPSGQTYTINNSSSSGVTVKVAGFASSQPANGVDITAASGTPITLTPNSSIVFRVSPNAPNTSGVHLEY